MESSQSIPKIIHQTWKTQNLPPEWESLQQTWKEHHPEWQYRFWTDEDNRDFLNQHYFWFLPVYDFYVENIKRVDAVRYFIMYHYGGVYADLDFESLRPLEGLLEEKELVLGWEPSAHMNEVNLWRRRFDQIIGNAFLASEPNHPFWEQVFKHLIKYKNAPGALDATGPFLITHAYNAYPDKQRLSIVSSDLIYPVTKWESWNGDRETHETRERITKKAFAIHHWHGSWRREACLKAVRERLKKSP